ncbi:hypothetical protein PBCV1_a536aL [Paramecium bursaria Chlorella virus 1]|uniref:Uncharacterized protein n=1 Tax=Paramecium bursaria Chlorella virus 1 TaxID=10506 RepID=F8TU52_PBCV1|nr:hypothetical protein PBCV1_a536aL [Paramecium bursaria Chlorella virus 1]AEI70113.1 hypothetical protein [Paramecium bursaria Chlorella virus 1]
MRSINTICILLYNTYTYFYIHHLSMMPLYSSSPIHITSLSGFHDISKSSSWNFIFGQS